MKIYHLASGNYNVRLTRNKQHYSFTFKHKPTKKEIEAELIKRMTDKDICTIKDSFEKCATEYIQAKSNVISPSTENSYYSILRNLSDTFVCLSMAQITALDVQREINYYSIGRSPKSVKNASGFISLVMKTYRPEMKLETKLPQSIKKELYIPTDEEVHKLTEAIKGSEYECIILLCIMGLRKSEALCITSDDLDGNMLTINKAKVVNKEGDYVMKTTKTTSSTRTIYIPDYLRDLINERGKVYEGFPGNILRHLHRTQDSLGIPRCRLHDLRHYYVSMAHTQGIPDIYIAKAVGHSSTETTRKIYLHAQKDKELDMQEKAASFLNFG